MSLKEKLTVSASPHVRSPETTTGIMLDVIISLIPALAASVWLFGLRTLLVTATTVLSCMLSEFFSRKIMKRQGTLGDLKMCIRDSHKREVRRVGIFEIADPSRIEALYAGWPETFIWSFLQGYMLSLIHILQAL